MGSEENFMSRPTDEFVSYLAAATGKSPVEVLRLLSLGRIAMAMELMTVARVIEDHSLLPSKEDTIAVIQTLIIDQDLLEAADEWYNRLSDWRRIKIADDADASHGVDASDRVGPIDAGPPLEQPDAPPGSDRSQDPP